MTQSSTKSMKKEKIPMLIRYSIMTLSLFMAFRFFIRGLGQGVYETFMGKDYWQGIFFFGLAVIVAYGINFRKPAAYIATVLYYAVIGIVFFLVQKDMRMYSPDIWKWYVRIGIGAGTAIPILADAVFEKRIKRPDTGRLVALILASFPVLFSLIYRDKFERGVVALYAMVWIYALAKFEDSRLEELATSIAAGGLLATSYALIKGFIEVPYHFEEHYIGNFYDSPIYAGVMCVGVVMSMALFLFFFYRFKTKRAIPIVGLILFSGMFVFAAVLANGRNTFLALVFLTILFAYILSCITGKKRYFRITLWSVVGLAVLVVAIIALLVITDGNKKFEWIDSIPQLAMMREVGLKTLRTKTREGIIPDGSWLNCIDNFTSERLTIWICTARQLKPFSGNSTNIHIRDEIYWPTHNTYLGLLNKYGIVMGAGVVLAWFYSAFAYIKRIKKSVSEKGIKVQVALPALFLVYCSSFFLFETFYVVSYLLIAWLFMFALLDTNR